LTNLVRINNLNKDEWKLVKKEVLSDLLKLDKFFKNDSNWCKRSLAKNIDDKVLSNPYEPDAQKFCLMGAAYKLELSAHTITILNECAKVSHFFDVIDLNDKTSFNDIKNFLSAVIKSVR
jgi:hypothetical protein